MLTAPQWQPVLELYKTAADLPPAAARSLLDSSNEDASILSEVARLLDSPEQQRPREVQPGRHAGLTVGRYRVIAALGRGGFGEVYEGWDRELARPVALKFMIPGYAGAGQAANHFIREARSASALNHPNIVTVHEVITWESSLVIVMELVEGAALRRICGQPLPLPQVIRIGSQILHALEFAHARGFVHRDLKPENVMVRPDGYVKVVDFGLARQFNFDSVASAAGLPAGTWRYTAPEQWRGQSASPASDVFAAGLILHEILTGRHPFHADSPLETAHAIAHRDPDPPSKLVPQTPPALESLIMRMLSKEASDRPPRVRGRQRSGRFPSRLPAKAPANARSSGHRLRWRWSCWPRVVSCAGPRTVPAAGRIRCSKRFRSSLTQPRPMRQEYRLPERRLLTSARMEPAKTSACGTRNPDGLNGLESPIRVMRLPPGQPPKHGVRVQQT